MRHPRYYTNRLWTWEAKKDEKCNCILQLTFLRAFHGSWPCRRVPGLEVFKKSSGLEAKMSVRRRSVKERRPAVKGVKPNVAHYNLPGSSLLRCLFDILFLPTANGRKQGDSKFSFRRRRENRRNTFFGSGENSCAALNSPSGACCCAEQQL